MYNRLTEKLTFTYPGNTFFTFTEIKKRELVMLKKKTDKRVSVINKVRNVFRCGKEAG